MGAWATAASPSFLDLEGSSNSSIAAFCWSSGLNASFCCAVMNIKHRLKNDLVVLYLTLQAVYRPWLRILQSWGSSLVYEDDLSVLAYHCLVKDFLFCNRCYIAVARFVFPLSASPNKHGTLSLCFLFKVEIKWRSYRKLSQNSEISPSTSCFLQLLENTSPAELLEGHTVRKLWESRGSLYPSFTFIRL